MRITWIALKLDPELCPEAVEARGGGLVGAQKCVVRAADHLASRLTGAGSGATVLNEEELTSAVATSACANPLVTAQAGRTRAARSAGPRSPAAAGAATTAGTPRTGCGAGRSWAARRPVAAAAGGAADRGAGAGHDLQPDAAPAASGRRSTLSGHVRMTGRSDDELAAARRALESAARQAGTGLVRLDREQVPGVLATLPLGGAR